MKFSINRLLLYAAIAILLFIAYSIPEHRATVVVIAYFCIALYVESMHLKYNFQIDTIGNSLQTLAKELEKQKALENANSAIVNANFEVTAVEVKELKRKVHLIEDICNSRNETSNKIFLDIGAHATKVEKQIEGMRF